MTTHMRLAATVPCTTAEGPFSRYAVWVQGCSVRCPGCCNPQMFDANRGRAVDVATLAQDITSKADIEGLTVLGGEPSDQLAAVTELAQRVAEQGLGVIVFSGRRRDELEALTGFPRLWQTLDTLVDGRFEASRQDTTRRFVGSTNQTLHHRTPRYADPGLWRGAARLEVVIDEHGRLEMHGAPQPIASLTRRLRES